MKQNNVGMWVFAITLGTVWLGVMVSLVILVINR